MIDKDNSVGGSSLVHFHNGELGLATDHGPEEEAEEGAISEAMNPIDTPIIA